MAAGFSSKTTGDSRHLSEIRLVLLGSKEADRSRVVRFILGRQDLTGEHVGHCTLYEGEQAGRRISVVDTPGWDSIQQTPQNKIRESIERSVVLCPPGPHALLLLIPVKRNEEPSAGAIKSAIKHVELLSERAWKHTIVLFACDEGTGDFKTKGYFQKATKSMLEKCRSYVLERYSRIGELLTEIEDLVEDNCDEVFLPQTYYELFKRKTDGLWSRRGRLAKNPPKMMTAEPDVFRIEPFSVIVMAVFGAFLVSLSFGTEYGVVGACAGLVLGSILPF